MKMNELVERISLWFSTKFAPVKVLAANWIFPLDINFFTSQFAVSIFFKLRHADVASRGEQVYFHVPKMRWGPGEMA